MRDTPRKLAATLLTLCSFAPILAPAPAVAAGSGRHHAKHARHGLHRSRTRPGRRHLQRLPRVRAGGPPAAGTLHQRARHLHARSPRRERGLAGEPAAQQAAAVIASVLATPCQNTEITPSAANLGLARAAVLCLINRVRAEHRMAPLAASPQLEAAAEEHCAELISDDYFAHVSPGGETPVDRIRSAGYIPNSSVGYVIGENLAWGTYTLSTPQAIVSAWVASPGHLANILESQYRETGIGITPSVPQSLGEGNPGATYAQEFGVITQ
ncbi:MAG: CAP domain-containing protein [Solirubrobacteraceae bacterium]